MEQSKGSLVLLLTAMIWGMAFVAQSAAAESIGSFTFNTARSFIGAASLFAFLGLRKTFRKAPARAHDKASSKRVIGGGMLCGIILFLVVSFQQSGIAAYPDGVAAAGRAGFLTTTYVVMVALFELLAGKKLHPLVLLAAAICVIGMYMLCLSNGYSGIYLGDVLVFICAICLTAHILVIDHFSNLDSIQLSCFQFFVCGTLSLVAMLLFEKPSVVALLGAWLPILYTGVLSSGVAYTLQMVGQKYTRPAVASIIMSLESVFAAIAGWMILNERLSGIELVGCGLVFLSVILAQVTEFKKRDGAVEAEIIPYN